jgi:hypothetical protein
MNGEYSDFAATRPTPVHRLDLRAARLREGTGRPDATPSHTGCFAAAARKLARREEDPAVDLRERRLDRRAPATASSSSSASAISRACVRRMSGESQVVNASARVRVLALGSVAVRLAGLLDEARLDRHAQVDRAGSAPERGLRGPPAASSRRRSGG